MIFIKTFPFDYVREFKALFFFICKFLIWYFAFFIIKIRQPTVKTFGKSGKVLIFLESQDLYHLLDTATLNTEHSASSLSFRRSAMKADAFKSWNP